MSEPRMARADVLFVAMCIGTIAFVGAFLLPFFTEQSIAWYYPVERRWAYEVEPTGLAMDFFGRTLNGTIAASVSVIVTIAIGKRRGPLGAQLRGLLVAWTLTAVVIGVAYFAWTLAFRVPMPEPVPAWYKPR